MKFHNVPAITFDDVLLVPQHTNLSRHKVNTGTRLTRLINIKQPIISANMDTVTEGRMAAAMSELGCAAIIHRFMPVSQIIAEIHKCKDAGVYPVCVSVGTSDSVQDDIDAIVGTNHVHVLCIDIAHGDSDAMVHVLRYINQNYQHIQVICGNVATPEATHRLIESGADAVKVGVGPGSMCTTRIVTGCGVPQLSAIIDCAEVGRKFDIPIIADGGIRYSGDIVKALAAGASSVMIGSLFAGTTEAPGDIKRIRREQFKEYRGMASKDAQVGWKGGVPEGTAPEGESTIVRYKGKVKHIANDLIGGIRSGMTYNNASNLHLA
jgi:IMP dehydrogenase